MFGPFRCSLCVDFSALTRQTPGTAFHKNNMATANPGVSSGDRLSFTLFLAVIVHAVLIFGVGFVAPKLNTPHVMEVTLALHRSDKDNPKADFLAQANQQGSGTLDEAVLVTSPHRADFHDAVIRDTTLQEETSVQKPVEQTQRQVVTTTGRSRFSHDNRRDEELHEESVQARQANITTQASSDDIASLEARLAARRQAYAKRPKVRTVSSVSTRYDRDAVYIDAFRSKIEQVGNQHYPQSARDRHLTGNVRLMVSITPDGRVKEIVRLKSSGHRILDEAAERSVRLAEPFQAFPMAIRRDTDILQIIRTWKFAETLTSEAS